MLDEDEKSIPDGEIAPYLAGYTRSIFNTLFCIDHATLVAGVYERADVLTISLHADPAIEYPYFLGFADELGARAGEGFNRNYPLPFGTDWSAYTEALDDAIRRVREFSPSAIVVALGLDTFAGDPTTNFDILAGDYITMGDRIATLSLPTLVVLEGGYAIDAIGENAANFLEGIAYRL